jgi:hypothetical protein
MKTLRHPLLGVQARQLERDTRSVAAPRQAGATARTMLVSAAAKR